VDDVESVPAVRRQADADHCPAALPAISPDGSTLAFAPAAHAKPGTAWWAQETFFRRSTTLVTRTLSTGVERGLPDACRPASRAGCLRPSRTCPGPRDGTELGPCPSPRFRTNEGLADHACWTPATAQNYLGRKPGVTAGADDRPGTPPQPYLARGACTCPTANLFVSPRLPAPGEPVAQTSPS